jgi:hypothetical protein
LEDGLLRKKVAGRHGVPEMKERWEFVQRVTK